MRKVWLITGAAGGLGRHRQALHRRHLDRPEQHRPARNPLPARPVPDRTPPCRRSPPTWTAVAAARQAFNDGLWPHTTPK